MICVVRLNFEPQRQFFVMRMLQNEEKRSVVINVNGLFRCAPRRCATDAEDNLSFEVKCKKTSNKKSFDYDNKQKHKHITNQPTK